MNTEPQFNSPEYLIGVSLFPAFLIATTWAITPNGVFDLMAQMTLWQNGIILLIIMMGFLTTFGKIMK